METVLDAVPIDKLEAVEDDVPTLDAVAREGARRMLLTALEEEVSRYIEASRRGSGRTGPASGRSQRPWAGPSRDLRRRDDGG